MPRGASEKREREYENLVKRFGKEGRYKGREKEVAARIVNKQRAERGETKQAQSDGGSSKGNGGKRNGGKRTSASSKRKGSRKSSSASTRAPLQRYDDLSVSEIVSRIDDGNRALARRVMSYEKKHKNRKTLVQRLEQWI